MPQHVIICTCGKDLVVDTRQAGETIQCLCGVDVDVPRLSDLRKLPASSSLRDDQRQGSKLPATSQDSNWSLGQGLTFAGGSLVILIAMVCAVIFFWEWAGLETTDKRLEELEKGSRIIDSYNFVDGYKFWLQLKLRGIGPKITPEYVHSQRRAATLFNRMLICGGAVLCGGGIAASSFFLGRRSSRRPRKAAAKPEAS